jgi:hypothetical protein
MNTINFLLAGVIGGAARASVARVLMTLLRRMLGKTLFRKLSKLYSVVSKFHPVKRKVLAKLAVHCVNGSRIKKGLRCSA